MKKQELQIKLVVHRAYSEAFKQAIVREYEKGILNKDQIQLKYGIGGHTRVLEWCRKYGKLHYPKKDSTGCRLQSRQKVSASSSASMNLAKNLPL